MKLKDRRKALKLTQEQVAREVGITRSLYGHYETGFAKTNTDKALRIAVVLGSTVEELFGSDDVPADDQVQNATQEVPTNEN